MKTVVANVKNLSGKALDLLSSVAHSGSAGRGGEDDKIYNPRHSYVSEWRPTMDYWLCDMLVKSYEMRSQYNKPNESWEVAAYERWGDFYGPTAESQCYKEAVTRALILFKMGCVVSVDEELVGDFSLKTLEET